MLRSALSRLHILSVFTASSLEVTLLSLQDLVTENTDISAILTLGINSFYHQVSQVPHLTSCFCTAG